MGTRKGQIHAKILRRRDVRFFSSLSLSLFSAEGLYFFLATLGTVVGNMIDARVPTPTYFFFYIIIILFRGAAAIPSRIEKNH